MSKIYEPECWFDKLGSHLKKRIRYSDFADSCEVFSASVYELENGKYAFITESGCSCYQSEDAEIVSNLNLAEAVSKYAEWRANNVRFKKADSIEEGVKE